VIRLDGLINPASWRSTWGSGRPMRVAAVREAWDAVRDQVLAADLMLAVHLDTPPERAGEAIAASPIVDRRGGPCSQERPSCLPPAAVDQTPGAVGGAGNSPAGG
jgi:hypothetical protein